jgi:hypothetical protein
LLHQDAPHAESFTREGSQWVLRESTGAEKSLELPALEITLALSEVYANVELVK